MTKRDWITAIVSMVLLVALAVTLAAMPADTKEQVIPPEDGTVWHVSVVGDPADPAYQRLVAQWDSDPKLQAFKSRCHFHAVTTESEIYANRYQATIKGLPTLRVQAGDGAIVYERHGRAIPRTGDGILQGIGGLAGGIIDRVGDTVRTLFGCDNGRCGPQPEPEPIPINEPEPVVIQPVEPEPEGDDGVLVLGLLGGAAGAGLGAARKFKERLG